MKEIKNNTRNDILLFWKYLNDEYSTNKNYLSNIIEFAHFQNLLDISWYELLQKYENYIPKIEDTYKHQIGNHVMLIAPSGQPLYTYSNHNYCRFIKGLIKEIHYNDKNELDDDSYIIVQNIENNELIKFVNVNNRQYYNYYILDMLIIDNIITIIYWIMVLVKILIINMIIIIQKGILLFMKNLEL